MSTAIEQYLDRVMVYANIRDEQKASEVRAEQADHLDEKIDRLVEQGVAREDAVFTAIEQHGHPRTVGYGLRPKFAWVDVRTHGTARGVIAVGPKAVGVFAFGGVSFGVFAAGGLPIGLFCFGGLAISLLFSWGGLGVSLGMAWAGLALATIATGGMACGLIAFGGMAFGVTGAGGNARVIYPIEEAPAWLANLAEYSPLAWLQNVVTDAPQPGVQWAVASVLVMVPFFAALIAMSVLQYREHRRIGSHNVWAAD